jgi:hypothetical protein
MDIHGVIMSQYLAAPAMMEAETSGFDWVPPSKLALQCYTIRHLQHHAGELSERLGRDTGVEANWVGMFHGE